MIGSLLSVWGCTIALVAAAVAADRPPDVVFVEPVDGAEADGDPIYRAVEDEHRLADYRAWLDNDSARWALGLYRQAMEVHADHTGHRLQPQALHVALVPGGNHADIGFQLQDGPKVRHHPRAAYVKLGPEDWRFSTTLLHETGHVVLSILNDGKPLPHRQIAAISHTTSALTDRKTAFDEGYAIHLETLIAHVSDERTLRNRYGHEQNLFGFWPGMLADYFRPADDLLSFAQTRARYHTVRENHFAFRSAFDQADYLRVQLDPARDFSRLRDANQLLQSEGFYASFFYGTLVRGRAPPSEEVIIQRQAQLLAALGSMLRSVDQDVHTPYLLHLIEVYGRRFPKTFPEIVDVFLDRSKGVFVDAQASTVWHQLYMAALKLDRGALGLDSVNERRRRWRDQVIREPTIVYSRVGPELPCHVPGTAVGLAPPDAGAPVSFDLNTVQKGIMQLIPDITPEQIERWLQQRLERPFEDVSDFRKRVRISRKAWSRLSCAAGAASARAE